MPINPRGVGCFSNVPANREGGGGIEGASINAIESTNLSDADSKYSGAEESAPCEAHVSLKGKGIGLSLAANFRWAFAGNAAYAICQWAMLFVLARWGTAEAVGQFVLGLAIAAPILSLAMLQLRSVQVTDVHQSFLFADYFGTRIVWTALGLVVIVVSATLACEDRATFWVVVFVGLMKSVDSVSDIVRGLFQHRERMDLNGISLMVKGVFSLIALATAMKLTGSVVVATAAAASIWALSFVTYDLFHAAKLLGQDGGRRDAGNSFRPRFRLRTIWRLTWIALPLGIVMAIISLQSSIPRYVLQNFAGNAVLGYFGAVVYPLMAGMMVTTALGQAATPRLAKYFAENVTAFVHLLRRLVVISAALGVALIAGTIIAGDRVLGLLYGVEYAKYHWEFVVVAFSCGIQLVGSCCGYGLTSARHFRMQILLTGAACAATLTASLVLVPRYEVMGAVLAVLVNSITMALGFSVTMFLALLAKRRQQVS